MALQRDKSEVNLFGCGLRHTVAKAPKELKFNVWLNITAPYIPITSDGKEPDLCPFLPIIGEAMTKAIRKVRRPGAGVVSQKDVVLDHLAEVIEAVSGPEQYRFNSRQLFYALRPIVMEETGKELQIGNFLGILDDYEKDHGEIGLMYREPRGTITHPHRDETITLGTLMVEQYERPAWSFNKLLYIEKEGAQEALKQDRWLERHDCAVMSSKGFSTRAARDLIDKLVDHDEPIEVFCAHDADASGTMIYQTLQEATRARGARKIIIINIGLEPWEAVEMGLEVETIEEKDRRKAVARYVADQDGDWEEWLQTHRIELERHDHAAADRMARPEDGDLRVRQADPAAGGAGRGSGGHGPKRKFAPKSPSASCARRTWTARSPQRWRHSNCPTARSSPAEFSNCSRPNRMPNGATMSRRSRRSDLKNACQTRANALPTGFQRPPTGCVFQPPIPPTGVGTPRQLEGGANAGGRGKAAPRRPGKVTTRKRPPARAVLPAR